MDVQLLLVQLFEELGYKREKQIKMNKLDFVGPAPGTYRFDKLYHKQTDFTRAYLTTAGKREMLEFFVNNTTVHVYRDLVLAGIVDLYDPDSIDRLKEFLNDHP